MRTFRICGLVLMAFLFFACLTSCTKSDEENQSINNTKLIEGKWYLNLKTNYDWDRENKRPVPNSERINKPASSVIWELKEQGDGFLLIEHYPTYAKTIILHHATGNEYYTTVVDDENTKVSRYVFKSLSEHELIVEFYQKYYFFQNVDYVVYNFIR